MIGNHGVTLNTVGIAAGKKIADSPFLVIPEGHRAMTVFRALERFIIAYQNCLQLFFAFSQPG
jgi:hypothetical protein